MTPEPRTESMTDPRFTEVLLAPQESSHES